MNPMCTSKLLYAGLLFALVACQAQATPPAPTAVPPTAAPTVAPTSGLTIFTPKKFELRLSANFGAEWSIAEEDTDVVTLVTTANYVDTAFIIVKKAQIAGPEAPFATVAFPADFVTWIQSHGLFHVTGTTPVVVGGFQGNQINANATPACGVKKDWLFLQSTGWNCRQGEYYRFIDLKNVNGAHVLILNTGGDDLSAADFKAGTDASQKVLDTVIFSK